MSTYLRHMGNYKHSHLKGKTYEEIERLFEKEMKRVNSFIPMDADDRTDKEQERSSKRSGDDLQSNVSKKQKVVEQVETEKVDDLKEEEMKKHIEIVRDDNTVIDVVPLATKPPTIVGYKIIKAGIIRHFQLIREDRSSKRHGDTSPEDEYERVLWGDLKVMFELDIMSDIWRSLQGYKVLMEFTILLLKKLEDSKMNIKFRGGLLGSNTSWSYYCSVGDDNDKSYRSHTDLVEDDYVQIVTKAQQEERNNLHYTDEENDEKGVSQSEDELMNDQNTECSEKKMNKKRGLPKKMKLITLRKKGWQIKRQQIKKSQEEVFNDNECTILFRVNIQSLAPGLEIDTSAFFPIIAHGHYYLIVFNLKTGKAVIIDNSESDATYEGKYKDNVEFVMDNLRSRIAAKMLPHKVNIFKKKMSDYATKMTEACEGGSNQQ
ncbi:hypothetical protein Tco_0469639 [Tanacetum coccineum]